MSYYIFFIYYVIYIKIAASHNKDRYKKKRWMAEMAGTEMCRTCRTLMWLVSQGGDAFQHLQAAALLSCFTCKWVIHWESTHHVPVLVCLAEPHPPF